MPFSFNPVDILNSVIGKFQNFAGLIQQAGNSHSAVTPTYEQTGTPIDNIIEGLSQIPGTTGGMLHNFDPSSIIQQIRDAYSKGDYRAIQGYLASLPEWIRIDPQWEKYLDNMIANQNTGEARSWEEEQASSNLLKAGSQLQSLGLSPSGVLQTGGSNVNGVAAASNAMTNLRQQTSMQRYTQRMAMARQLLGMTSQMAAAGIYGGALGAAKSASSALTSAASHSALGALSQGKGHHLSKGFNRQKVLDDLEAMNVYG